MTYPDNFVSKLMFWDRLANKPTWLIKFLSCSPLVPDCWKLFWTFLTCQLLRKSKFSLKSALDVPGTQGTLRCCSFSTFYLGSLYHLCTHAMPTGSPLELECDAQPLDVLSDSTVEWHYFLPITLTASLRNSFFLDLDSRVNVADVFCFFFPLLYCSIFPCLVENR